MSRRPYTTSAVVLAMVVVAGVILMITSPAGAAKPPRLSLASSAVAEDGIAVVTMRLSRKAPKAVTVRWRTADQTARAGSDYQQVAGTVKIAKGKRSATIRVPLIADQTPEPTEQFTIKVTAKRAKAPARPVAVTIQDDDAPAHLAGQLTLDYTTSNPHDGAAPHIVMTMGLHLTPTDIAGEWRDDGSGTWSAPGVGGGDFQTVPGSPLIEACPDTGGSLVLGAYRPSDGATTPYLDTAVETCYMEDVSWQVCGQGPPTLPPGYCPGPILAPQPRLYDFSWADGAPGASGNYTGTSLYTRGVAFDYNRTFVIPSDNGYREPETVTVKVTGHLDPVH